MMSNTPGSRLKQNIFNVCPTLKNHFDRVGKVAELSWCATIQDHKQVYNPDFKNKYVAELKIAMRMIEDWEKQDIIHRMTVAMIIRSNFEDVLMIL